MWSRGKSVVKKRNSHHQARPADDAPLAKRQRTSTVQPSPTPSTPGAQGLGCAIGAYYVTDMHTGRVLKFEGPRAYFQARGRMVAGLYGCTSILRPAHVPWLVRVSELNKGYTHRGYTHSQRMRME
jgi:hypothetical protein